MFYAVSILSTLTFIIFDGADVRGSCARGEPAEKTIKIDSCEVVDPYEVPQLKDFAERYPKAFVASYRETAEKTVRRIMESYRGAILVEARREKISKYFLASQDKQICDKFGEGKTFHVVIEFACCDGDPNPPCYLGLGIYVVKVIGAGEK